ncbi:MAG TPA: UDP-N-acetylmuramate dehydrogenase [Firmicutes bacterium]|nr:UDP-N-acetylmuramate dehydrogenase [Bacillota bacterium]
MDWKKELVNILSKPPLTDEPMSLHTSLRIGGPAEIFAVPQTFDELRSVLQLAGEYNIPLFVLGHGTNLLVRDGGIRGIVLSLHDLSSGCSFFGNRVRAGAGVSLSRLVRKAAERNLKGLEFAAGIPGSLGGALYMNAGAYGSSISELVREVVTVDYLGNRRVKPLEELDFSYRCSSFQSEEVIILEGVLELKRGNHKEIMNRVNEIQRRRQSKHPQLPSAGSVFRNPPGNIAGKLVEGAGCKGMSVGEAEVSPQHGNFIVNKGNASAADVLNLIELVKQKVRDTYGLELELEIRVIGEKGSE